MRACPVAKAVAGVLTLGWTAGHALHSSDRRKRDWSDLVVPRLGREHSYRAGPAYFASLNIYIYIY
eukprot:4944336-Heterocapsa_arctica.AAC.1